MNSKWNENKATYQEEWIAPTHSLKAEIISRYELVIAAMQLEAGPHCGVELSNLSGIDGWSAWLMAQPPGEE